MNAKDRLIVALDYSETQAARGLVERLDDAVRFYKIGYRLAFSGGFEMIPELKAQGKSVFLDMKLLDIDRTVETAVGKAAELGVDMLTIHAYPAAMRAAVRGAQGSNLCLLGVTVLTSMNGNDLREAGYSNWPKPESLTLLRVHQSLDAGMGGVVCSPLEASIVRKVIGENKFIVTPGIRPANSVKDDHRHPTSPSESIQRGASHLIVGRPITSAGDPVGAARRIIEEIEMAINATN